MVEYNTSMNMILVVIDSHLWEYVGKPPKLPHLVENTGIKRLFGCHIGLSRHRTCSS